MAQRLGLRLRRPGARGATLSDFPNIPYAYEHRLARMAGTGDTVLVGDRTLEVVEVDGHRITRVRLHTPGP